MSAVEDILRRMVGLLDDAGIPLMIAGSFASNAHGAPRPTQDLDIVVDLRPDTLEKLLGSLSQSAYHVDPEAAREALRSRSTFYIVDLATAWRVDLIVQKDRPFSRTELARRVRLQLHGIPVYVASAEDTIVAELEWSKRNAGSETQLRNVASIMAACGASLDLAYVQTWVDELGLADEWAKANGNQRK
jgi:hypothetical protein